MKVAWIAMGLALLGAQAHGEATAVELEELGIVADPETDCTAALQAALDDLGETGGVLSLPPGEYRIEGTLTLPPGVALEGSWLGPHTSQTDKGTTLLAYSGRGDETADPFISLQTGSTLKGVTIIYPEQKVEDIQPYPWTIQGRGQHYNVIDVTIANAYNGIDCGTYHNEGHHLRNVHMCCARRGVLIDQCTDIGRVENVHVHNVYWWRVPEKYGFPEGGHAMLEAYTRENLEGFIIGRTDWEYMTGCFVIWAKIGFRFIQTDTPVGGVANVVITRSGSDLGPVAVLVEKVQAHAGIAFENCQFMSGFEIRETNRGPVKLSNCGFWGPAGAGSQMVLEGRGTVFLSTCHFDEWDPEKPCIDVRRGALICQGSDFMAEGLAIRLGQDAASATIIGNRFRSGEMVVTETDGPVEIIGNVGGEPGEAGMTRH
ncbi:MAG: hypothetical protein GF320_10795 [Armatimonadia bacterium]|nr:hypothetical protein [Armatimonadia bacterium]